MPHDRRKFSQADLTVGKSLKSAVRRLKANARERCRMHDLNAALDRLRRSVPVDQSLCVSCTGGQPKLSKIDTLRLARNYILVLSKILCEGQPIGFQRLWKHLSAGLSQATASLLTISLENKLDISQASFCYRQGPEKHDQVTAIGIVAKQMFATEANTFLANKKSITPFQEQQLHPSAWSECDDPILVPGLQCFDFQSSINKNQSILKQQMMPITISKPFTSFN